MLLCQAELSINLCMHTYRCSHFLTGHMNGFEILCLIYVQNCLIQWSHYSSAICKGIVDEHILFWLIRELYDLPYAHTSQGPGQEVSSIINE